MCRWRAVNESGEQRAASDAIVLALFLLRLLTRRVEIDGADAATEKPEILLKNTTLT